MLYQSKPKIVEAYQYTKETEDWFVKNEGAQISYDEILEDENNPYGRFLCFNGLDNDNCMFLGDWLIKSKDNFFTTITIKKNSVFREQFEEVPKIYISEVPTAPIDYNSWQSDKTSEYICQLCGGRFSGIHFCCGRSDSGKHEINFY
jgi:hypothetical protein